MPFVRIASGPERDTFVALSRMVTTIGRGLDCTIQLFDDTVSRRHCRIVFEDDTYWIEEVGPANAVILNRKRLGRDRLVFGSQIILGQTVLEFVKNKAGGGGINKDSNVPPPINGRRNLQRRLCGGPGLVEANQGGT